MSRINSKWLEYGLEEVDPKIKFNSLLSATVSTIMCLAAKYPIPRVNVETTKLFLSKITDDNGQTPRNVKGFLSLLNNYSGPYDGDSSTARFEKGNPKKFPEKKTSLDNMALIPRTPSQFLIKEGMSVDTSMTTKRTSRTLTKKSDREPGERARKPSRIGGPRVSSSRSVISSK